MFNMGMGEIIVIMGVLLVVMGPERFPVVAKMFLRLFRDVRGYWDEIQGEITKELDPVKKELSKLSRYNPEDYIESLGYAISTEPKDEEAKDKEKKDEEKKNEVETKSPSAEADTSEATPAENCAAPAETVPRGASPAAASAQPYQDPYGTD